MLGADLEKFEYLNVISRSLNFALRQRRAIEVSFLTGG